MMNILILTQYFPPEVGAPQNRLFELSVRLQKLGLSITVLTAMPNYPQMEIYPAYKNRSYMFEEMQGLKVHRSSIYVSRSKGILHRLRNYFSFVISSARTSSKLPPRFDFLICESPPLFLGYSAMYLARKKKAKLIFNVSDLWPESAEKLGVVKNTLLLKMAYRLEARLYRRAALVTGQTQGICQNIHQRFPEVPTYWLPNGVDLNFYDPSKIKDSDWREKQGFRKDDLLFLYAGILGLAQGLEVILYAADKLKQHQQIKFLIMGSGPEKDKLLILRDKLGLKNVFFLDAVTKSKMPGILRVVDASVIPLRRLDLFLGAIPSKIFECLAMELPVLLGVDGEARELFVKQGRCALYFEPEDAGALANAVLTFSGDEHLREQLGRQGRIYVNEKFNRETIASAFYARIQSL